MTDTVTDVEDQQPPNKNGKKLILIGLVLALALGAGLFYATYSGMILASTDSSDTNNAAEDLNISNYDPSQVAFVSLDPMVIDFHNSGASSHLRFSAQLEVPAALEEQARALIPRVQDITNSYLRTYSLSDIKNTRSMMQFRIDLQHRAQLVFENIEVKNFLITEFVVN